MRCLYFVLQTGGKQTMSIKGQTVNIFGFAASTAFVETTQLCRCAVRAAIDNM